MKTKVLSSTFFLTFCLTVVMFMSSATAQHVETSCTTDRSSYAVSTANTDNYAKSRGGHSLILSKFDRGRHAVSLSFSRGSYLTFDHDGGSACITGVAKMTNGSLRGTKWKVYIPFKRKKSKTRPKKELKSYAYDLSRGGIDPSLWELFIMADGAVLKRIGRRDQIKLKQMPSDGKYGLQIGYGANGKNKKLGASAWFFYSHNGRKWRTGDINVDLDPLCDNVKVTNACASDPSDVKWLFKNYGWKRVQLDVTFKESGKRIKFNVPAASRRGPGKNYVTRPKSWGTSVEVVVSPFATINYDADLSRCPVTPLEVVPVCSDMSDMNQWRVFNPNSSPVLATYRNEAGQTVSVALAANDNTIITASSDLETLHLYYGADQVVNTVYTAGPCSIDIPEPSCTMTQKSFDLSSAVYDPAYTSSRLTHSFYLPNFNGGGLALLQFEEGAYMTYSIDGKTAYVKGTATMSRGNMTGSQWQVSLVFEEKPSNMVPKRHLLLPSAYDPNDGQVDPSSWKLFSMTDESFIRQLDGDNYIKLRTMPEDGKFGLQIGEGASLKNTALGASLWFFYMLNGQEEQHGDMNVSLEAQCPSLLDSVTVTTLCTYSDDFIDYAIKNTNDVGFEVNLRLLPSGEEDDLFLPKAGEGDELPGGDGELSYSFFRGDVSSGTQLEITVSDEVMLYDAEVTLCDVDNIELFAACSDMEGKYKWIVSNENRIDVEASYEVDGEVISVMLPRLGKGLDINGIPKKGNFTFIYLDDDISELTINYGNNQSLSAVYSVVDCITPECDINTVTYALSNAVSDSYHAPFTHNLSLWLASFDGVANTILDFEEGSYLTYELDGSKAEVYGTATVTSGHLIGSTWEVYMPFGPAAAHTVPKPELTDPSAYDPNGGAIDTLSWLTFLIEEGGYMRRVDAPGEISMKTYGFPSEGTYGFQIGDGANGKNIEFGAGGWFLYSYNGQGYQQGDINVNLTQYCPPVDCDDETLTYELSNAVSDSYHAPYNHNLSLWFSSFAGGANTILDFDDESYITYKTDGSEALVYGTATVTSGNLMGSQWEVFMPFGPAATNTIPKPELTDPSAYDVANGGVDINDWALFLITEDAFMRRLDGPGFVSMMIYGYPAAGVYGMQIGLGANGKNINLGAGGWFLYSYNGQTYQQGDINVDMDPFCDGDTTNTSNARRADDAVASFSGMKIFPNPASEMLNIAFSSNDVYDVVVVDLAGNTVAASSVQQMGSVDVKKLNPGVYVIKAVSGTQILTSKFEKL